MKPEIGWLRTAHSINEPAAGYWSRLTNHGNGREISITIEPNADVEVLYEVTGNGGVSAGDALDSEELSDDYAIFPIKKVDGYENRYSFNTSETLHQTIWIYRDQESPENGETVTLTLVENDAYTIKPGFGSTTITIIDSTPLPPGAMPILRTFTWEWEATKSDASTTPVASETYSINREFSFMAPPGAYGVTDSDVMSHTYKVYKGALESSDRELLYTIDLVNTGGGKRQGQTDKGE